MTGFSTSPTYPIVEPLDLSPPFGSGGNRDSIVTILSANLSAVEHSPKFGDAGSEFGAEVAIGPEGALYPPSPSHTTGGVGCHHRQLCPQGAALATVPRSSELFARIWSVG